MLSRREGGRLGCGFHPRRVGRGPVGNSYQIRVNASSLPPLDQAGVEQKEHASPGFGISRLSSTLQRDIKGLFPSYADACKQADALLFSVGKMDVVTAACAASPIGQLTPEALYVHLSALDRLSPVLRVFEGCARAYIGRVEGANLIKLNRSEPDSYCPSRYVVRFRSHSGADPQTADAAGDAGRQPA